MAELTFRIGHTAEWPDEKTKEDCEKKDSVVAHIWIRDKNHIHGPIEVKFSELSEVIKCPYEVSSDSDWKYDVIIPGLKLSGAIFGRFG